MFRSAAGLYRSTMMRSAKETNWRRFLFSMSNSQSTFIPGSKLLDVTWSDFTSWWFRNQPGPVYSPPGSDWSKLLRLVYNFTKQSLNKWITVWTRAYEVLLFDFRPNQTETFHLMSLFYRRRFNVPWQVFPSDTLNYSWSSVFLRGDFDSYQLLLHENISVFPFVDWICIIVSIWKIFVQLRVSKTKENLMWTQSASEWILVNFLLSVRLIFVLSKENRILKKSTAFTEDEESGCFFVIRSPVSRSHDVFTKLSPRTFRLSLWSHYSQI